MWEEDKGSLKGILRDYSVKEIVRVLAEVSAELSDELSDVGLKEKSKQLTIFSISMEEISKDKPFLK
jgi:hypothetical protein